MSENRTCHPLRLAVSMMLIRQREQMEVLVIKRAAGLAYGSAIAFPGGNLDAADEAANWLELVQPSELDSKASALRICGWREVFEETGLTPPGTGRGATLREILATAPLPIDLSATPLFARWTTPPSQARRWDTYFFLCPGEYDAPFKANPAECAWAGWMTPNDILAAGEAGEMRIPFPTYLNLLLLAGSGNMEAAVADARRRTPPEVMPSREEHADRIVLRVPVDAGFPINEMILLGDATSSK